MLYSIRFKSAFNNFNPGYFIKFKRGNFMVSPYGGGKSSFARMLFEYITTGASEYIEGTVDSKKYSVYYLNFINGLPELQCHNVSAEDESKCRELIDNKSFELFYELFRKGELKNYILISDDFAFPLTQNYVTCLTRYLLETGYNTDTNAQVFLFGSNGFSCNGYYCIDQEVYSMLGKVWLNSTFVSRSFRREDWTDPVKLKKEIGWVVMVKDVNKNWYRGPFNKNTFYLESADSLAATLDSAKVYSSKTLAEKSLNIFRNKRLKNIHGFKVRRNLRSRNEWFSSLDFSKAIYEVVSKKELEDRMFNEIGF